MRFAFLGDVIYYEQWIHVVYVAKNIKMKSISYEFSLYGIIPL